MHKDKDSLDACRIRWTPEGFAGHLKAGRSNIGKVAICTASTSYYLTLFVRCLGLDTYSV